MDSIQPVRCKGKRRDGTQCKMLAMDGRDACQHHADLDAPPITCKAYTDAGERCKVHPVRGGDLCVIHGGISETPATFGNMQPPADEARPNQCTGKTRSGARCLNTAIKGGMVCVLHGGRIPSTVAAARRRLLEMVAPALTGLQEVLDTGEHKDVVPAARIVLDRAGLHPSKEIIVQEGGAADWARYLTDEQLAMIEEWVAEAKRRRLTQISVDVQESMNESENGNEHE